MAHLMLVMEGYQQHRPRHLPRPRVFRDRTQPLDTMNDEELIDRYRLPRHCILHLCDALKDDLERPSNRSHALSVPTQVLTGLRFFATGSLQRVDGDVHGISQPSVSRCVTAVSTALCRIAPRHIEFPKDDRSQREVMASYFKVAGFPGVLGCVDGTQIEITSPSTSEHLYICRKGYHAINVQGVCDAQLKFLNVVAKWPGSTHDAFIWRNSSVCRYLEHRQATEHGWLLGDSAYPLSQFLLTPVLRPTTPAEVRYNKIQRRTRNTVERAFGVMKMRFRCLHKTGGCLQSPPHTSIKIITACAVLHNICIDNAVPHNDIEMMADDDEVYTGEQNAIGTRVRARLIQQRFGREA
jgi:hypothetical protein